MGSPERVFNHPDTRFTAEFFGAADFLPAWREGNHLACEVGRIPRPSAWPLRWPLDKDLQVMVRPDCLQIDYDEPGNGVVAQRDFLGAFNLHTVQLDSGRLVQVMQSHITRLHPGTRVNIFLREGHEPLPFVNGRAFGGDPQPLP